MPLSLRLLLVVLGQHSPHYSAARSPCLRDATGRSKAAPSETGASAHSGRPLHMSAPSMVPSTGCWRRGAASLKGCFGSAQPKRVAFLSTCTSRRNPSSSGPLLPASNRPARARHRCVSSFALANLLVGTSGRLGNADSGPYCAFGHFLFE